MALVLENVIQTVLKIEITLNLFVLKKAFNSFLSNKLFLTLCKYLQNDDSHRNMWIWNLSKIRNFDNLKTSYDRISKQTYLPTYSNYFTSTCVDRMIVFYWVHGMDRLGSKDFV